MRRFFAISLRTLVVLLLVVSLPLLAIPPVGASVGDWMDQAIHGKQWDVRLALLRRDQRSARDQRSPDQDNIRWQADPVVRPERHEVAVDPSAETDDRQPPGTRPPDAQASDGPAREELSPGDEPHPQMLVLRQNLIEKGVQYMRLEELEGESTAYHFYCLMPLGGRAVYSRRFEKTDSSPVRAMESVLDEIERWQESQSSL